MLKAFELGCQDGLLSRGPINFDGIEFLAADAFVRGEGTGGRINSHETCFPIRLSVFGELTLKTPRFFTKSSIKLKETKTLQEYNGYWLQCPLSWI